MGCRKWVAGSLFFWLVASVAIAAGESPDKMVQAFVEANRQGRFAAAQALLLEQADVRASLFGNWLFGMNAATPQAASAGIFLSRKFTEAFRYKIIDTTMSGENQATVISLRTSPNINHLYSWAVAPHRGAAPYALIESVDTYLTKINYPLEESRMVFTLVQELDSWLISAIYDERFGELRESGVLQPSTRTADDVVASIVATGIPSRSQVLTPSPSSVARRASAQPLAPSGASNVSGREVADAQFNATLQSLNRVPQDAPTPDVAAKPDAAPPKEKSFMTKIAAVFGGGEKTGDIAVSIRAPRLAATFENIRNAFARYAGSNNTVPDELDIYDWPSLRKVVNFYSKRELPISEKQAGFSFVNYSSEQSDEYVLLVELHNPQDGLKKVELRPNSIERVN